MKIAPCVYAGAYATSWQLQVGRLWVGVLYLRFWRTSGPMFVRWIKDKS